MLFKHTGYTKRSAGLSSVLLPRIACSIHKGRFILPWLRWPWSHRTASSALWQTRPPASQVPESGSWWRPKGWSGPEWRSPMLILLQLLPPWRRTLPLGHSRPCLPACCHCSVSRSPAFPRWGSAAPNPLHQNRTSRQGPRAPHPHHLPTPSSGRGPQQTPPRPKTASSRSTGPVSYAGAARDADPSAAVGRSCAGPRPALAACRPPYCACAPRGTLAVVVPQAPQQHREERRPGRPHVPLRFSNESNGCAEQAAREQQQRRGPRKGRWDSGFLYLQRFWHLGQPRWKITLPYVPSQQQQTFFFPP